MSPDGEAIVTGAGDETLRFWNVFSKARSQKVCLVNSSLGKISSNASHFEDDVYACGDKKYMLCISTYVLGEQISPEPVHQHPMMDPQVLNSFNAQVIQFLLVAKYMVAPVMLLPCCTEMQFLRLIVSMRGYSNSTVYLVYLYTNVILE